MNYYLRLGFALLLCYGFFQLTACGGEGTAEQSAADTTASAADQNEGATSALPGDMAQSGLSTEEAAKILRRENGWPKPMYVAINTGTLRIKAEEKRFFDVLNNNGMLKDLSFQDAGNGQYTVHFELSDKAMALTGPQDAGTSLGNDIPGTPVGNAKTQMIKIADVDLRDFSIRQDYPTQATVTYRLNYAQLTPFAGLIAKLGQSRSKNYLPPQTHEYARTVRLEDGEWRLVTPDQD